MIILIKNFNLLKYVCYLDNLQEILLAPYNYRYRLVVDI